MKTYWLLFLLFFGLLWIDLPAQNPVRSGTDHALFFVVQEFDHWHSFPDGSTQQVKDIELELQKSYGFQTEFVMNPTRQEILTKITDYEKRKFGKDDQLLIYFSTHGHFEEKGTGALIPKDGLLADPIYDTWITHPLLADLVNRIPCRHILLSLDACYSGTFGGSRGKPQFPGYRSGDDCASKVRQSLQHHSRYYLTSGGLERTPTNSYFADKWLEALRVRNPMGLLNYHSLFGVLSEAKPRPMFGDFRDHEPGGDFVFVNEENCSSELTINPGIENGAALTPSSVSEGTKTAVEDCESKTGTIVIQNPSKQRRQVTLMMYNPEMTGFYQTSIRNLTINSGETELRQIVPEGVWEIKYRSGSRGIQTNKKQVDIRKCQTKTVELD